MKREATLFTSSLNQGKFETIYSELTRVCLSIYMRLLRYSDNLAVFFLVLFAQLWFGGAKIAWNKYGTYDIISGIDYYIDSV